MKAIGKNYQLAIRNVNGQETVVAEPMHSYTKVVHHKHKPMDCILLRKQKREEERNGN